MAYYDTLIHFVVLMPSRAVARLGCLFCFQFSSREPSAGHACGRRKSPLAETASKRPAITVAQALLAVQAITNPSWSLLLGLGCGHAKVLPQHFDLFGRKQ